MTRTEHPPPPPPPSLSNIIIDNRGTTLSYIDSGIPSQRSYTTIFAVHGLVFTSPVFQRVVDLAPASGLRFVAITRRDYPGSTSFTPAELAVLSNSTDGEKAGFLRDRGLEIAKFMNIFIQKHNLPPISRDGKSGGVALLGWSLGNAFTLAAISSADMLPADAKTRLGSYLRAVIIQEAPSIVLGLPLPPQTWSPLTSSIPVELQIPAFVQWITAYFQHGDLSTRDPNVLSYIIPTTACVPSIYDMTAAEISWIVYEPGSVSDSLFIYSLGAQLLASYRKACFDSEIRSVLPNMKIWKITGDATASFSIASLWSVQDDDKEHGGKFVNFKVVSGANHFMHWDEPQRSIEIYLESL